MIRSALGPARQTFLEALTDSTGFWPLRLAADEALFGTKPQSGWQFFAGPGLALECSPGGRAVLCGRADPEELASFLRFLGVGELVAPAEQPSPAGFALGTALTQYRAMAPLTPPPAQAPWQLEQALSPRQAAALLGGLNAEERENLFAESCARRNHGQGYFWGAMQQGTPVSVVGVCAQDPDNACMFAGETLPAWRGRGIGGGLIAALANALLAQGRTPWWVCRPERRAFYDRLGAQAAGEYIEYIDKGI